jgi:hypothetical protein
LSGEPRFVAGANSHVEEDVRDGPIGRRTLIVFREHFVERWTLREIGDEFDAAGIRPIRDYDPGVRGERRVFVEQHYRALDLENDADVRRLLAVFGEVLRRAERDADGAFTKLKGCLAQDGFEYRDGILVGLTPRAQALLEGDRATDEIILPEELAKGGTLSGGYVREILEKCSFRLTTGDWEGAITVARTLLEAVLCALEVRLVGASEDYKGDLPKQFKRVAKRLRIDEQRPDIDERFKEVVRGLVMVVNGLAPLRNKLSDGHARARKPAEHHARAVVNAAKTVAVFLVDSYRFQASSGLLGKQPAEGGTS